MYVMILLIRDGLLINISIWDESRYYFNALDEMFRCPNDEKK